MSSPFLFVNKNANSATLSSCDGEIRTAIFRHVQEQVQGHVRMQSMARQESYVDSGHDDRSLPLGDFGSFWTPPPSDTAESEEAGSTWLGSARTHNKYERSSILSSTSVTSDGFSENAPNRMTNLDSRTWATVAPHAARNIMHRSRPDDVSLKGDQYSSFKMQRSICYKDRAVDPFDCASIPISQEVHHLLTYFERLFCLPNSMALPSSPGLQSACSRVVRDCIFDEVQMRCILTAMAARREYFDGAVIEADLTELFVGALAALQSRLSASTVVSTRLIYSIMKLCHAEGYRHNLEAAIVHLRAAQIALRQLGSWRDLDPEYAPTFCGSGHAFVVSSCWRHPLSYPCLVDPGRAISCFPQDFVVQFVLVGRLHDGTGQALLTAIASSSGDFHTVASLQQLISDLIEFSTVKNNTLLLEQGGVSRPQLVVQWMHFRRYALLSQLLSMDITQNDFLHAIRVSLIFWLTIIANYRGYSQDLKGIASHLQDVLIQVLPFEERDNSEIIVWMLMIGAIVGDPRYVRPWFLLQLSNFSKSIPGDRERSSEDWFTCLENICHETLYCEQLQKDSVAQIAEHIVLLRS